MSTVIIDIETAPLPLSPAQKVYVTREVKPFVECAACAAKPGTPTLCDDCLDRRLKEEEDEAEALGKAALSPLFGQVVCVGMLNADSGGAKVISIGGDYLGDNSWHPVANRDERSMLAKAWEDIGFFQQLVTFNGRSFDIPFLMIRSAALGVTPSRFDLLGYRYSATPHCDLLEQLTYYGATRRAPLWAFCEAFGIKNPKEGCDGSQVAELFAAGRHQEIAEYCLGDLKATAALYKVWRERMCKP